MSGSNARFTALSEDEDNTDFMTPSGSGGGGRQKSIHHPVTCLFHVLFRTLAVLVYIFCQWFTSSFVIAFVVIALLHSMDFWTVKNVTGRLLVGLRWWNEVTESGASEWYFESRPKNERHLISASESTVFWVALIAAPSIWFFLFLTTLFSMKFAWMMIVLLGLSVTASNLYGYTRCRLGSKRTISGAAAQFLGRQVINAGVAEMQQQSSSKSQKSSSMA
ncbi:Golgi apparatus membrane protein TVP23 homolog B-like [Convolutriloba macropyga]|uniref:Golgi apparatus membrane protein TVP23 homolog B-like n=1 Tax=Convolutriloba macropyga TaxID=536237 RepID=UPI003F51BD33